MVDQQDGGIMGHVALYLQTWLAKRGIEDGGMIILVETNMADQQPGCIFSHADTSTVNQQDGGKISHVATDKAHQQDGSWYSY